LRAVERLALEVAIAAAEIFAERMQPAQELAVLRRAEARDERLLFFAGSFQPVMPPLPILAPISDGSA